MTRSLSIAAYLARLGSKVGSGGPSMHSPKPEGAVIWARCSDPDQVTAIETLNRKLSEDGDDIQIITTLRYWSPGMSDRALTEPKGKEAIRAFIAHWKPLLVLWVRGDLDPILLQEMRAAKLPLMLVDAAAEGLDHVAGSWVPGMMRSLLSQFELVLAVDRTASERLIRAGASSNCVRVSGAMEDCPPALPFSDEERDDFAKAIGTRPVWLAASVRLTEIQDLCTAQMVASRTAHRLLLIVVPENASDAKQFARRMRKSKLMVSLRSEEEEPTDLTQIYIVDTEEELGLWYRLSPITYVGGTLSGGNCRDPFEPASLGSAVIYGTHLAPYHRHASRLNEAGAACLIRYPDELGPHVEALLSTEICAKLAHAAWEVTSRGADVTNRLMRIIQHRIEDMDY